MQKHKYTVDDNFFSSPNSINSYWAGFIAADGNIEKTNNRIRIGLSSKDRELLEVFKQQTNFSGPITDYESIAYNNGKSYPSSKLGISSKQWKNDLINIWNILPNKSLTLKPPELKNPENVLQYIIGYFDGDGSCGYNFHKGNQKYYFVFNFVGTTEILKWIFENLDLLYHQNKLSYENNNLNFWGKQAEFLHSYLFKINTPYKLKRKWDAYIQRTSSSVDEILRST